MVAKTWIVLGFLISISVYSKTFSVMSYNAENLFDTYHDDGKNDYTYLPLSLKRRSNEVKNYCRSLNNYYYRKQCFEVNWTPATLEDKIQNLSRVIHSYEEMPDILVLQEVENIHALRMLNDQLGYREEVLIEGPDRRGIDVAILSKFKLARGPRIHNIDIFREVNGHLERKFTRGILEAVFEIDGKDVAVLANHWPSQGNPDEYRELAAKRLREVSLELDIDIIIAAGDFNTREDDDLNGIKKWLTDRSLSPRYYDSFEMSSYDVDDLGAPGTHYYRGHWELLDKILVWSKYTDVGATYFRPQWSEFNVHVRSWMLEENSSGHDVPFRFDLENGRGMSDHLPVVMKFTL